MTLPSIAAMAGQLVTRLRIQGAVLAALLLVGWAGERWAERAAATRTASGVSLGALAGFRAIAADVLWLRTYFAWERRDADAVRMLVASSAVIDPRPLAFWVEGARMLAYDVPQWELWLAPDAPAAVRNRIVEQHADAALRHLARARGHHPDRALLWIEAGNIHLNVRGDLEQATEAYRQASSRSDAPHYAARIYAELLRRRGKLAEAYAFLKELYPALDRITDPWERELASPDVVLSRIRDLEQMLGVESRVERSGSAETALNNACPE